MNRRQFFAMLVAPFAARLRPKPNPPASEPITISCSTAALVKTVYFGSHVYVQVGNGRFQEFPNPYWHGRAPFVMVDRATPAWRLP